jgi:hypothetical protein
MLMQGKINPESLQNYRSLSFRVLPEHRLKTKEEAVQYVNQRGFIFFWPIKNIRMPSLWTAVAGDRPVADAHDDPGHVSWGWKDELLCKNQWYYAKILRKRATIISKEIMPYFYALSENYGSPEEDYLTIYEQGRLTQEAKSIYEALLREGPLDTITLRKISHLTSHTNETRYNRAMTDLQTDFKILPVGITEAGSWHYAYAYDIVPRHFSEQIEQARTISDQLARQTLTKRFLLSVGAARYNDICLLFGWSRNQVDCIIESLVQINFLQQGLKLGSQSGDWIALNELIE